MLHHHLCHFAQLKELEIEEVCKAHCHDFILAVNNLWSLLSNVDSLKSSLSDFNSHLQHVTCLLLLPLNTFVENAMSRRMWTSPAINSVHTDKPPLSGRQLLIEREYGQNGVIHAEADVGEDYRDSILHREGSEQGPSVPLLLQNTKAWIFSQVAV